MLELTLEYTNQFDSDRLTIILALNRDSKRISSEHTSDQDVDFARSL